MHIYDPSHGEKLRRDDPELAHAAHGACGGSCHSPSVGALHGGGRGAGLAHELRGDRDAGRGHGPVGGGGLGTACARSPASPKASQASALGRQAYGEACAHGVEPKWAAWPHGGVACACRAQVAWHSRLGPRQ